MIKTNFAKCNNLVAKMPVLRQKKFDIPLRTWHNGARNQNLISDFIGFSASRTAERKKSYRSVTVRKNPLSGAQKAIVKFLALDIRGCLNDYRLFRIKI